MNSSLEMDKFSVGIILVIGRCIKSTPWLNILPRWIVRPTIVPRIAAKITAGIYFIGAIEKIPIPIEQALKIIFNFSLKSSESLLPKNPPNKTDEALTITPIGIFELSNQVNYKNYNNLISILDYGLIMLNWNT